MSNITPDDIMQLALGFWGSRTLLSAVKLGVFTEIATRPVGFAQTRVEPLVGPDSMVIGVK